MNHWVKNGVVLATFGHRTHKVRLLRTHHTTYVIYSTVGLSIASISDLGTHIYLDTSHLGRISAMDLPTILAILSTQCICSNNYTKL